MAPWLVQRLSLSSGENSVKKSLKMLGKCGILDVTGLPVARASRTRRRYPYFIFKVIPYITPLADI
jgi:hypothetical protein